MKPENRKCSDNQDRDFAPEEESSEELELCPECGLPRLPEPWDFREKSTEEDGKRYCVCEKP